MKKYLLFAFIGLWISSACYPQSLLDLYPKYLSISSVDKLYDTEIERINGKEEQILNYDQEKFHLFKDSIVNPEKIRNVQIVFTEDLDLQKAFNDLAFFPNLFYLKFSNLRLFRGETQLDFPEDLSGIDNVQFINLYGNFNWDKKELFADLAALPRLRFMALYALGKEALENVHLGVLQDIEGLVLSGREGITLPASIKKMVGLKSLILSADLYPDFAEQFIKLKDLPQLREVHLSNFSFSEEDQQVFRNFSSLHRVELKHVKVPDLDMFLGSLSRNRGLVHLEIFGSGSNRFNSGLAGFEKLKYLRLERLGDSIRIPGEVYSLEELKTLIISDNDHFTEVDPKIGNLKDLDTLILYFNKIEVLPNELGNLQRLKKLDVRNNGLKSLPAGISRLSALVDLNLSGNSIEALPEDFGDLRRLEILKLDNNLLVRLPSSFSKLENLKYLNLNNNDLTELHIDFGELKELEFLSLIKNLLRRLPESFGGLTSLKTLQVQNNNLKELPDSFGNLRSLTGFSADNRRTTRIEKYDATSHNFVEDSSRKPRKVNAIRILPPGFSNLERIERISLSGNPVEAIPLFEILKNLEAKKYSLFLDDCQIKALPPEGWSNILVQNLSLPNNEISKLPENIKEAPYLKSLNLSNNPLGKLARNYSSREKLLIAFDEAGFIEENELPRNTAMAGAYLNLAYSKIPKSKQLEFFQKAFEIDSAFTAKNIRKDDYAEALLDAGKYPEAINYFTRAIVQDTSRRMRVLNFIIPQFQNRAEAYLATGDTLAALKDLEVVSEKFSANKWGDAMLLARQMNNDSLASYYLKKGVENYHRQMRWNEENDRTDYGIQLSLLELVIISEDFSRAGKYFEELEKEEIPAGRNQLLLDYLGMVLDIVQEKATPSEIEDLKRKISGQDQQISGWSFELFYNWIAQSSLDDSKKEELRALTRVLQ